MTKWVSPSDFAPKNRELLAKLPTFVQIRRFLDGLGFEYRTKVSDGRLIHVYEHKPSDSLFVFPDYPATEPMPNHAVQPVHYHLTWNGVIDDVPYEDFLDYFSKAKAG
jgi:hypothetical protein